MTPLQAHVVGLGDKTAVADLNRRLFESSSRLQFSMKAHTWVRLQALDLGPRGSIYFVYYINLAARLFLISEGLVSKLVTK